jgi:hypothetical protein
VTSNDGVVPVVDVDQVFPLLTADSAGQRAAAGVGGGDQGPVVTAVLREVLGWRPRATDTKAFTAALAASFRLTEVEGHVETRYVPRGFAIQADLGAVSGGQASLYARARAGYDQIGRLLDGLVPLRPDADADDCAAFRLLVRHGVSRAVEELGNPGGPRRPVVDSAFTVLAGAFPGTARSRTADDVPGQLGALRDRFGLVDANVNTVDDESVRTAFWTLVDLILDIRRAWEEWKTQLAGGTGSGFLGTDLVVISRLMAAAAEQVDELEAVLDSVLVTAAERQTLRLNGDPTLTLDGLLCWLRRFLTEDGPMYARDSGRDGMRTAFAPTAQQLALAVQQSLVTPIGALGQNLHRGHIAETDGNPGPVVLLPASCRADLPPGMYAARSRIAVVGLCRLLCDLFETSARISRYPGVVLFDAQFQQFIGARAAAEPYVRVSVRGANIRPTYLPAFVAAGNPDAGLELGDLQLPLDNSVSADDDTLVGVFRSSGPILKYLPQRLVAPGTAGVVVPAEILPLAIVDGETGQIVTAPPVRSWPTLAAARSPGKSPDWSAVADTQPFPAWFPPTMPPSAPDAARASAATAERDQAERPGTPPAVSAVRPISGPRAGGKAVLVCGTGLTGVTGVRFGQLPATAVSVRSDTELSATTPAGSGRVDVTVLHPAGDVTRPDAYTYR